MGVDAEALRSRWGGTAPSRLHAVGDAGMVAGRALCLAPVTLLDPALWRGRMTATTPGRSAGSASR